jgi:hypothetical protein
MPMVTNKLRDRPELLLVHYARRQLLANAAIAASHHLVAARGLVDVAVGAARHIHGRLCAENSSKRCPSTPLALDQICAARIISLCTAS